MIITAAIAGVAFGFVAGMLAWRAIAAKDRAAQWLLSRLAVLVTATTLATTAARRLALPGVVVLLIGGCDFILMGGLDYKETEGRWAGKWYSPIQDMHYIEMRDADGRLEKIWLDDRPGATYQFDDYRRRHPYR